MITPAANFNNLDFKIFKPQIVPESEFIRFSEKIIFLKNNREKTFLKLTTAEAGLIRLFNGKSSLADILKGELEKSGTDNFQKIFELITDLNLKKFLISENSQYLKKTIAAVSSQNIYFRLLEKISVKGERTLYEFPDNFNHKLFSFLSSIYFSYYFLGIFFVLSLAFAMFWPDYHGLNIFQSFFTDSPANVFSGFFSYFISGLSIWFFLSLVISLKNLFSAFFLKVYSCDLINPRISFFYGLIIFNVDLSDIVRAGRMKVFRLFLGRILFPFVLITPFLYYFYNVDNSPLILLGLQTFLVLFFVSVSPVFHTDLNRALDILKGTPENHKVFLSFFKKKFLKEIFNFKNYAREYNYYLFISGLSLVWFYFVYYFFWSMVQSTFVFLITDLISGAFHEKILIVVFLLIIVIPFLAIIISSLLFGLSNLNTTFNLPLQRIKILARDISAQKVLDHDQIILFLREIPLFSQLNGQELKNMCGQLRILKFNARQNIIIQGTQGDKFYTIVSGQAAVIKQDKFGQEREIEKLDAGDSFGEIALVESVPRTATVRAITPVILFALKKKYFDKYVTKSAGGKDKVTAMIRLYKLLMNIGIFSYFTPRQINLLITKLKTQYLEKDEIVFKQNDIGECFYLIKEGGVQIEFSDDRQATVRKNLIPGDFFGEIALLKNIPRTATVKCLEKSCLLYLTKNDFQKIVLNNVFTGIELDGIMKERITQLGREAALLC